VLVLPFIVTTVLVVLPMFEVATLVLGEVFQNKTEAEKISNTFNNIPKVY
jgi:hypothetical protein